MMVWMQGVIEPGSGQEVLMTICRKAQISATSCSFFEVAGCDRQLPCVLIALRSMMLWVQGAGQWAGGADDHLDESSAFWSLMLCF